MIKFARVVTRILLGALALVFLIVLAYIGALVHAWIADSRSLLPEPSTGQDDFSRLTHATAVNRSPAK